MATMTATAPMTEAQGKFLTSLLNDLTRVAPAAGAEARTRLRAMHAAGTLDKRETSRAIDVLKRAITVATAPAPRTWEAPAGAPLSAARPVRTPAPTATAPALDPQAEMAMLLARREAASTLRKGPAKAKGGSRRSGPSVVESLRSWTPERARLANEAHARGETPF